MCLKEMDHPVSRLSDQLLADRVEGDPSVRRNGEFKLSESGLKVASATAVEQELYRDILAGGTEATRKLFEGIMRGCEKLRRSTAYKILTRTTQPSHAISMLFVSFMLLVLWPNIVGQSADADSECARPTASRAGVLVSLAYIGSFAMHFGAQMWMTFVSGLALYFNLPRHTFGRIQEILFPKYFSMGTALSVVTLLAFIKLQQAAHPELSTASLNNWEPTLLLQVVALALCAALELIVWLYMAPPMLRLMHLKYNFEARETVGQEVGQFSGTENAQLRRSNPYQNVHKRFRQIHMATAMTNMGSLLCTFIHLHYLASRVELR
ncbi:transmembrane protein 205 [Wyeomyia smithii]|uniref:transmembrane protein 205 n=1 Tax=Wyeomyia smithii TaxID=174621 RepID=UPI002467E773|nr:transmembrane protein 205 [Wyeomyia smithii]